MEFLERLRSDWHLKKLKEELKAHFLNLREMQGMENFDLNFVTLNTRIFFRNWMSESKLLFTVQISN